VADRYFYQIYPRSFQDSSRDRRRRYRRHHSAIALPFDTRGRRIWLSPIFPSRVDFGYDISDYTGIDPLFGTMDSSRAGEGRARRTAAR